MRVLVDTSVWADFLNGYPSAQGDELAALMEGDDEICTCGVVVAEVFQGLRQVQGRDAIRRSFEDLRFLEPSGIGLYLRAAEVFRDLLARGRTIRSTVDCVIAVLAEENGCAVLARDRDLDTLLSSGVVDVPVWPNSRR